MARRKLTCGGWLTLFLTLLGLGLISAAQANQVHNELWYGSPERALELLKKDPSLVRSRDSDGDTPLHLAAGSGHLAVVRWLLEHKAAVNDKGMNGFTPLHVTKSAEIAKLLLRSGADPTIRDSWGNTALQRAAEEGHTEVADAITDAGYPLDLVSALWLRKRNVAKKIIREHPEVVKGNPKSSNLWDSMDLWGNTTPLGIAAEQGDQEMVLLLLQAGAPVNGGTFMPNAGGVATPLCNAVWAGKVEVVEILCKAGANCNVIGGKFDRSLLEYAKKHSDKQIVDLLVKYGAKDDPDGLLNRPSKDNDRSTTQ